MGVACAAAYWRAASLFAVSGVSSFPLLLPSQTRAISPSELARARTIAERIGVMVEERQGYVERNGIDPGFAYPDANWSFGGRNAFRELFARVARCDEAVIGQLRAFTQIFTGHHLYEVQRGRPMIEEVASYTDEVVARALAQHNGPYLEAWRRLTADLPLRYLVSLPARLGEIGHDVNGIIVNHDSFAYQEERVSLLVESGLVARLERLVAEKGEIKILEIGAGWGGLASWFKRVFPNCSYTIVDLPECLLFSSLYLALTRPDLGLGWSYEPVAFGFRFVPNYAADGLRESFDLVINTLSMSEMSEVQVRHYAALLKSHWLTEDGLFFEQNQDNRHLGFLCAGDILAAELPGRKRLSLRAHDLQKGVANLWSLRSFDALPAATEEAITDMRNEPYDLFLTHAWRYHEDWTRLGDMLDRVPDLSWRNFSVPWYDPAVDPNTEAGGRFIRRWLESQIAPVAAMIFLDGVYATKSARKWLDLELEIARARSIPVIGLAPVGQTEISDESRALVDMAVDWDADQILAAVDRLRAAKS
jgi:hypothetical protein